MLWPGPTYFTEYERFVEANEIYSFFQQYLYSPYSISGKSGWWETKHLRAIWPDIIFQPTLNFDFFMSNFKMAEQDSFTCLKQLSSGSDWRSSVGRLSRTRSLGEESQSASLVLVRPRIRSGSEPIKVRHDSSTHSEEITSLRLGRTGSLQGMREIERHGLSFDKVGLEEWKLPIVSCWSKSVIQKKKWFQCEFTRPI